MNLTANLSTYIFSLLSVIICTLIGFALQPYVAISNLIMLYLLGVVVVTILSGRHRGPSIAAAFVSTLLFDYFFIEPYYSFSIYDLQYFFTFVVIVFITQLISHLTIRLTRYIEATKKAQQQTKVERSRNLLLASISHDLRTPLTVIMGSASSLLQKGVDLNTMDSRELVKDIYEESKRLNNLACKVLQMIRLESGIIKIDKKSHAMEEIIANVLDTLAEINKPININLEPALPLIQLDQVLIEQVLSNLIDNAYKHASQGNSIMISAEVTAKELVVKISDNGPGLNPREIENIFEKFYRKQNSENFSTGFGLGLAICKNIINAHDGQIWAENNKGTGMSFCFTLPLTA